MKIRELIEVVKLGGPLGVGVHLWMCIHAGCSIKTVVYYNTKLKPETGLPLCLRVSLFAHDSDVKIILVARLLLVPGVNTGL